MIRRPPRSTRTDTLFPYTTLFRSAMAAATTRPEKVIGWHWSSPAQVMEMAEIVVAPGTSEETRDAVVELARLCGKNPVVVRDNADPRGHVGTRVYAAPIREAKLIRSEEHPSDIQSLLRISY